MFEPITRALIHASGVDKGWAVLDVAGGVGEPSISISPVVGPSGVVICPDAVREMVGTARRLASQQHLTNTEFTQCLAESLPFPDRSFDAVVCRLGGMVFPDPQAAS